MFPRLVYSANIRTSNKFLFDECRTTVVSLTYVTLAGGRCEAVKWPMSVKMHRYHDLADIHKLRMSVEYSCRGDVVIYRSGLYSTELMHITCAFCDDSEDNTPFVLGC